MSYSMLKSNLKQSKPRQAESAAPQRREGERSGPTAAEELPTPVGDLAAVEGRPPAICGTAEAGRARRLGRSDGRQRARPVEAGEFTGFGDCTAQFLLRLARDSETDWPAIAQPAEPPDADPHVRWCARGGAARLPPIPIPNSWRSQR